MPKALYYNAILAPKEFDVLAKNKDGTYEIGIAGDAKLGTEDQLVVGKVELAPEGKPKEGFITLVEETKPEAKPESKKTSDGDKK